MEVDSKSTPPGLKWAVDSNDILDDGGDELEAGFQTLDSELT